VRVEVFTKSRDLDRVGSCGVSCGLRSV
jgi:hypothetical protein